MTVATHHQPAFLVDRHLQEQHMFRDVDGSAVQNSDVITPFDSGGRGFGGADLGVSGLDGSGLGGRGFGGPGFGGGPFLPVDDDVFLTIGGGDSF